jgi:H+/Cl- antiporter ClcA
LLSLLLIRGALLAAPFAAYFAWRSWARRTGRQLAPTPWIWLVTVGCLLVGASLLVMPLFARDTRGMSYIPAETQADGSVRPGRFVPKEER